MTSPLFGADVVSAQIDRLVSGDLPESDRRSLLAWLDEEPSRWRTCALAFLEAQTWEQAVAWPEETREGEAPAEPRVQGSGFRVQGSSGLANRTWIHWLAIAGLLLIAFGAGAWSAWSYLPRPAPAMPPMVASGPQRPIDPLLATVSVRTNLDPRLQAQLMVPVEPAAEPSGGALSISDYDRAQWERRGYELVEETRYLPAKMPDGRPVMVPVKRVRLKLKGTPVS
ncbi:MAG: hypothetical protein L0211_17045 [Planctomycetaceae bacterium]|nr:hypothetical protein [Planctomycetaceae bacterium]